ncbi:MAG: hypothetical protein FGF51_04605 [Candidatus Brockarchaeota archaeon]|nr:hypothetical protein [Candidatus Brockarchaeota archaeon]
MSENIYSVLNVFQYVRGAEGLSGEGEARLRELYKELEVARSIEDKGHRSTALSYVAEKLAEAGRPCEHVFDEALEAARSIEDKSIRSRVLRGVVEGWVEAGRAVVPLEPEDNATVVAPVLFRVRRATKGSVTLHIGEERITLNTDKDGYAEFKWKPRLSGPAQLEWWAEAYVSKNRVETQRRRLTCLPYVPPPPEVVEIDEMAEKVKSFLKRLEEE